MALLDELATFLEAQALGLTVGTNLFKGRLTDTPAVQMALAAYPGGPAEYIQEQATAALVRPRVQAVVRNPDYAAAEALCQQVVTALEGLRNATLDGVRYLRCRRTGEPFLLRTDGNDRFEYAVNVELLKAPA